ncbi:histone-lysine N-methyltransferase SUV39H2-like [Xenia sp. Carnegie-2017]|uniref:histone-lysine N-methyltransferase SUV39H2-like n=1 Tax=Xenia sp. Carnegie-2017 TaxID=2897299 RepID=UPI001F04F98D|nr:histone-lysine N-methyltransferase SUV39H2-like [Xenia sp. Carnegie-2017]
MVARGGGEPYITLENRVDFEKFPENFSYTCRNIPGPGVLIWPDPAYIVACDCKDRCNEKCSCPLHSGSEFAYDFSGRVTLARRRPIYECNMKCPCRSNCGNRVVQRGRQVRVCIFRTKRKGWGLKTLDYIHANQFVTEYVGEILTSEDAEERGQTYDQMGQTYLFDLDYNDGDCVYTIDAFRFGNVAHFINHSCDPNLIVYGVWIDNVDPQLPHIALFATRDIQQGEELTFDYLMTATNQSPTKSKKHTRCHCKSANCRKWLF